MTLVCEVAASVDLSIIASTPEPSAAVSMYGSAKVVNITIGTVGMSCLRARPGIDAIHDGHYEVYHNEVWMKCLGFVDPVGAIFRLPTHGPSEPKD